jgi:hypothetical protein
MARGIREAGRKVAGKLFLASYRFRRLAHDLRWRFKRPKRPAAVMFDRSRDLDDPMNDPAVQERVGKAIAMKSDGKTARRTKS